VAKLILLLLSFSLPMSAAGAEGDPVALKYTLGFDYSSGDYGLEDETEILYMPLGLEADFCPFLVKVTVPLILVDGPFGLRDNGSTPPTLINKTTRGIGRLSGRVSYIIPPFHEASVDGISDSHDLVGFASVKLDGRWFIGPYGSIGLSEGSPDFGFGVLFSFRTLQAG